MGVYIKGMAMPKSCLVCSCTDTEYGECVLDPEKRCPEDYHKRADWCSLVPVPEPHGDMKDINHINQVLDRFSGYLDDDMIYRLKIAIGRDAPTIIPASEEGE